MNWKLIDKSKTAQPNPKNGRSYSKYEYRDWKEILAKEGFHQCVYCSISDATMGIYNFQVEHFKPKKEFPALKFIIENLFYSCPICNRLKGVDWWASVPGKGYRIHFPDPSKRDYKKLFIVDKNGYIRGDGFIAKYMVIKLGLNRNQLILDRKLILLLKRSKEIRLKIKSLQKQLMVSSDVSKSRELLNKIIDFLHKIEDIKESISNTTPYSLIDTKR